MKTLFTLAAAVSLLSVACTDSPVPVEVSETPEVNPTNDDVTQPVTVYNGAEGSTSHVNAEHYVDFPVTLVLDEMSLYIDQFAVELSITSSNPDLQHGQYFNACVMADEAHPFYD